MNKEEIFILDSEEGFKLSEEFKQSLENEGYILNISSYGFNGVRIRGFKDE